MTVCGVPELGWPYACPISENNGLHFDPATGRLWVPPQVAPQVYTISPAFEPVVGSHQLLSVEGTSVLRVWAAGAYGEYGELASITLTSLVEVEHTNNSCVTQYARGLVRQPAVRWMTTWQANRFSIVCRGYLNGVQVEPGEGATIPHDGRVGVTAPLPGGSYPWGTTGYPVIAVSESAIGLDAEIQGMSHERVRGSQLDLFTGWQAVPPGDTVTFGYQLGARTPQEAVALNGPLPDVPYLAAYADVLTEGTLTVEVFAAP